jgi:hypothetical protein
LAQNECYTVIFVMRSYTASDVDYIVHSLGGTSALA